MPGLAHYMAQYDHEHSSVWNKVLHGIGIPLIFAGLILLALLRWRWGIGCFLGGWVLLFSAERAAEDQSPGREDPDRRRDPPTRHVPRARRRRDGSGAMGPPNGCVDDVRGPVTW